MHAAPPFSSEVLKLEAVTNHYKSLLLNDAHLQLIRSAYYFGSQEVKTASTPPTPPPACIQCHVYCYVSGRGDTARARPFCHTSTSLGSIHDRLLWQHAEMEIQAVDNNWTAVVQLYNADDEGEEDRSDATRRRIQCLVATVVRNTLFHLHCHLQLSSLWSIWFSWHQFFSH